MWKHSTLRDIEGVLTEAEMEDFLVFTLVRNPWDRMVSYYHWLRDQNFSHVAVGRAKRMRFSEFLADPETQAAFRAAPSDSYVTGPSGRMLGDLFLRFEDLPGAVATLEARLGVKLPPLERVNASERPVDYRAAYGEGDAEQVAEMFASDISRFGYRFDSG